ncbi:ASCH domain-containing protein [Hymenobacter persicinus]|uniref:ASCH domain-containing protein n=1 Tax=Hymenobacter persicinus TaxID=2025506 RepID=A0A4Q5LB98_9BACT|nr:hypothetical protein [Hymenobacter persicinus]RYU79558.1 hypothetical protein EWM57_10350 [Hymenobacter persicinus]
MLPVERPISFNPSLLGAVNAGRKTVTRRRLPLELPPNCAPAAYRYCGQHAGYARFTGEYPGGPTHDVPCPFGTAGDRLRVIEQPELVLLILSVRAERVRAITEVDARAEGVGETEAASASGPTRSVLAAFQELIDQFYSHCWARNEWVWVVEFRRLAESELATA